MSQHTSDESLKVFQTKIGQLVAHEQNDLLGKGTYGVVYKAHLKSDPSIKRAVKTFSPETMDESEGIPSTTLREINALKTINHPNVMSAEEVVFPAGRSPADMFFVMELCKGTLKDKLAELIKKHLGNDRSWLKPAPEDRLPDIYVKEAKVLAWELLNALAVVHSRGIMHRDLKPVNILWSFDDLLKLADFGLARFVRGNQNAENTVQPQTGEVQTMWYRAPEVLLGDAKYGLLVDDWSLGCVIAEMFRFKLSSTGRLDPSPLFQGRSDVATLLMIFETLGTPRSISKEPSHEYLFKLPYWTDGFPQWYTSTLRERVPLIDDQGFDLLTKLLRISPSERKPSRMLLDHAWFDDVRNRTSRFQAWYEGSHEAYVRMMMVDKMSLPRILSDNKENDSRNNHAQEQKPQQRGMSKEQFTLLRNAPGENNKPDNYSVQEETSKTNAGGPAPPMLTNSRWRTQLKSNQSSTSTTTTTTSNIKKKTGQTFSKLENFFENGSSNLSDNKSKLLSSTSSTILSNFGTKCIIPPSSDKLNKNNMTGVNNNGTITGNTNSFVSRSRQRKQQPPCNTRITRSKQQLPITNFPKLSQQIIDGRSRSPDRCRRQNTSNRNLTRQQSSIVITNENEEKKLINKITDLRSKPIAKRQIKKDNIGK